MVHGRFLAQAADGRQHAEGIGGQEDNHLGNAAHTGDGAIFDVLHGVAHAGVLGQAAVVEVKLTGLGVHDHVLDQGAELDGVVDVRLVLRRQVDALGIAAALKVEHAVGAPAMLVIADQLAGRVGRQGGLASAGQAEEHGGLMGLGVHVGRAVHGQHVLLGHHIVHGGEHALLDLTGVPAAADDDHVGLVVDHDGGFAVHAVHLRVALEAGGHQHGVIGLAVSSQLLGVGADEQLMDEHILAGQLVHNAELLGVLLICTGKAVKNEHLAALQVCSDLALDGVELLAADGAVHLAPGDVVVHALGVHNKFVVRRAAGVLAGGHHQCAGVAQGALAAAQGVLSELCRGQVAVNSLGADDAQLFDAIGFHTLTTS